MIPLFDSRKEIAVDINQQLLNAPRLTLMSYIEKVINLQAMLFTQENKTKQNKQHIFRARKCVHTII